jgi:WD40 repeat protein
MRRIVTLVLSVSVLAHAAPGPKVVEVATLKEAHEVGALEFTADGAQLVVMPGAYDREAHVWNWREREIVATLPNTLAAPWVSVAGKGSPDGRFFVHCADAVTIWDAPTWQVRLTLDGQVRGAPIAAAWPGNCQSIGFSPDGSALVVLRQRGPERGGPTVSAYDTTSWTKRWSVDTAVFYPRNLAFGADGTQVAIAGMVNNIERWPGRETIPTFGDPPLPDTGLVAILDLDKHAFVRTIAIPETSFASRQTVTWQAQRNALTFGANHALRTVDASSGALLGATATENIHGQPAAFLSPDGRVQIETGFGPKEALIRVVDVADGTRKVLLEIPARTRAVAWSRDSRHFALGGAAFSLGSIAPLLELMAPSKGKVVVYELRQGVSD